MSGKTIKFLGDDVPAKENECQIMLYNVQKSGNIGNIIRSAVAFGASEVVIVGNRQFNTFGNQNTNRYINFRHYPDATTACTSLKARGFKVIGVEIGDKSKNITTHPFDSPVVFMMGNEGSGLSDKQISLCDDLVYIPQYGKGTASLNVSNAAAIILHHYATWAGYQQQTITGEKFDVEEEAQVCPNKRPRDGESYEYTADEIALREERLKKKQMRLQQDAEEAAIANENKTESS